MNAALDLGELSVIARYLLIGTAASAVLVVGFATALDIEARLRRLFIPVVVLILALVPPLAQAIHGRDLGNLNFLKGGIEPGGISAWMLRLGSAAVVGLCLVRIISQTFDRTRPVPPGAPLYVALVVFVTTSYLLPAAFGSTPFFGTELLYPLFIFGAVYASRSMGVEGTIWAVKLGLLAVMLLSLAFAFVRPQLVMEPGYASLIPGVSWRFWGLSTHATAFGPTAMVATLLLLHQPLRSAILQWSAVALSLGMVLVAQSKSTWLIAVFAIGVLMWLRQTTRPGRIVDRDAERVVPTLLVAIIALGVTGAGLTVAFTDAGRSFVEFWGSRDSDALTTLTGRAELWRLVPLALAENPLFGYGLTMWNSEFRAAVGLPHAFSAHNQFLQSLGVAGAVGLAGLVIYLAVLTRYAIASIDATRGLSVALLVATLIGSITETPFELRSMMVSYFLLHLLLFQVSLAGPVARAAAAARARSPTP
jgi:O-antigen ligase